MSNIRPLDLDARHRVFVSPTSDVFPNPVILRAKSVTLSVRHATEALTYIERHVPALRSSSGRVLELGNQIKTSIYGFVMRAEALRRYVPPPREGTETVDEEEDLFERTGEVFAIKVYRKDRLREMQGRTQERPLQEIPIVQYLGNAHPNVLGQIECCTDDDSIFLIMRYVEGGELFDYIETNGPLDEPLARDMFRQLLSALSHMQRMGIAHRDLSLENILFDGERWFVVIDFGMAVRLLRHRQDSIHKGVIYNETTITAQSTPQSYSQYYSFIHKMPVCGKKNYIAPEVNSMEEIFHPMLADVWALGVMLFIALTGLPPFDSAVERDARFRYISEGHLPQLLAHWGISISEDAVDLLTKMFKVHPLARPLLEELWAHPWVQQQD